MATPRAASCRSSLRTGRLSRPSKDRYSSAPTARSKAGVQFGGQQGDLNYIAGASRFRTDGYRDHSAATRDQFNAKLSAPVADGKLTLLANGLDQPESQDPLGLSRAQFEADPRQVDPSAILFDTRKSVRQAQLGAIQELSLTPEDRLQARLYGGTRTVKQFLAQTGDTPLGSGGVVDLDRGYGGLGLRWTRTIAGGRAALHDFGRRGTRPPRRAPARLCQQCRRAGGAAARRGRHRREYGLLHPGGVALRAGVERERRRAPQPRGVRIERSLHRGPEPGRQRRRHLFAHHAGRGARVPGLPAMEPLRQRRRGVRDADLRRNSPIGRAARPGSISRCSRRRAGTGKSAIKGRLGESGSLSASSSGSGRATRS